MDAEPSERRQIRGFWLRQNDDAGLGRQNEEQDWGAEWMGHQR
jgi:hypothetical protein